MISKTCPDRESIQQLLLGKIPRPKAEELEEHLLHCDDCSAMADTISASDELTAAMQSPDVVYGEEDIVAQVIERGKLLPSGVETVQSDETLIVGRRDDREEKPTDEQAFDAEEIDFLTAPEQSDEIGRLGDYRVFEVLGVGGMGVVFRAEDPKLKRQIALKAMKPSVAVSKSAKDRFIREAQSTAAIEHDNIVHIYQVGEDCGVPFIAMQFLQGESLQRRLEREQRLDQRQVLRIGREVATGLAAAHERDLIHRDIKPDNIWIEENTGRARILDFGLVRSASEDGGLTQSGIVVGTPKYMAPEQAQGQTVDHRCDLFSLGSVLYRLVAGKSAFAGNNMTAMLMAVVQYDPEPLENLVPGLDPGFAALITGLLQKNPDDRPPSAAEVAQRIADIERKLGEAIIPQESSGDSLLAPTPATRREAYASRLPGRLTKLATAVALLLLPLCLYFGGTVIRFVTNQGLLVVKVNDENVEIAIKQDGVVVKDKSTRREFQLRAVAGEIEVYDKGGNATLLTKKFTLARGGEAYVTVTLQELAQAARTTEPRPSQMASTTWAGWPTDAPAPAIAPFGAEQARRHQQAWAKYLAVPVAHTNSIGMKFQLIPPGEFLLGTADEVVRTLLTTAQQDRLPALFYERFQSEGPQRRVVITRPFYLGTHEVTVGQFRVFANSSEDAWDGWHAAGSLTDEHPASVISWDDANRFAEWLSKKEQRSYRLPKEAEWEFACRAGTDTPWHTGKDVKALQQTANVGDASLKRQDASKFWAEAWDDGFAGSAPVGGLESNAFGLHDMHGNLYEWCADWYSPDAYQSEQVNDLGGPDLGTNRVVRSGSYKDKGLMCRSAARAGVTPNGRLEEVGIRVLLEVP